MDCPSCSSPNPDSARFCGACGAAIAAAEPCPRCGAANPPGQHFCNACGETLSAASAPAPEPALSAAALAGERKQVTVLFADVQGSMDLAGDLDAEGWRRIMERFLALLSEGVQRYEGTVNKFTGDGIMALFGAPVADEDHARHACYAALHLRDELARYAAELRREQGLNFSVRMGLNSGEVVMGSVGNGSHQEYTAIGNTVGLASRIEQLAEPGSVYLADRTAGLVGASFRLEDLGEFEIKGVGEPVRVHRLAGVGAARTRLDESRERGLSRFVGRDEEMAALEVALEHAAEGDCQIVGIVAEPGLGKSRLCYEFAERCRARGIEITEGHGVAHGKRVPLLPVLHMMRGYFGITDEDSDRVARDKIAGRLLLLDERFKEGLPLIFDFLGVPDPSLPPPAAGPEARQRQLFRAIRLMLQTASRSRGGPALAVMEDLHWLDPGSEAFLENYVEALPGTKSLVVVNFRPEYRAAWMQKSYYRQLPLLPLGAAAVRQLLDDLLGEDPSLDGLAELIHERTGGNPFFVEEVARELIESGALEGTRGAYRLVRSVEELAIPATVQAVLAARIDRLPEREKAVLQTASVIGRRFTDAVLSRVARLPEEELASALRSLVAAELLYEEALYPEAEYSFKHPLTEEVAYRSQLAERRKQVHAAVAAAITEVYADRLDEMAAIVANHWEQAGEPLEAARASARAAAWAGQNHPADALRHWRRVRALLRDVPTTEESLWMGVGACLWTLHFGWRLGLSEEEAAEAFEQGRALAERTGDVRPQALILAAYGISVGFSGRVAEALEYSSASRALAAPIGDPELVPTTGTGYWLTLAGRLSEGLADIEESIALTQHDLTIGRQTVGFSAHLWARMFRAAALLSELGPHEGLAAELDEVIALAREQDDSETLGWALGACAAVAQATGEPAGSLARAREGVEVAERLGGAFQRQSAYTWLALAHLLREEWDEARQSSEAALAILEESRAGLQYEGWGLGLLSAALLGCGEGERAIATAREAVAATERCGVVVYEAWTRMVLAQALLSEHGAGAGAEIEDTLACGLGLAEQAGARACEVLLREQLAELARVEGDEARRDRELQRALQICDEIGATGHARRLAAAMSPA